MSIRGWLRGKSSDYVVADDGGAPALFMTRLGFMMLLAGALVPGCATHVIRDATLSDDTRVRYELVSQGAPSHTLVLVHGWSCDRTVWRRQMETLGDEYRVIAIDLPGHGESDQPLVAYTMDYLADSVVAVMDHAHVDRAVLVGHSNGTPVIRQAWRRHPERTEALVVVDGALKPFFDDPAMAEGFVNQFRSPDYLEMVRGSVEQMLPLEDEAMRDRVRTVMTSTPQRVMVSTFEGSLDPAIWEQETIDVPVLCYLAAQPAWDDAYEAYVRALCPDLTYVTVPDVSHFLMIDDPDHFEEAIEDFLEEISRAVDFQPDHLTQIDNAEAVVIVLVVHDHRPRAGD